MKLVLPLLDLYGPGHCFETDSLLQTVYFSWDDVQHLITKVCLPGVVRDALYIVYNL